MATTKKTSPKIIGIPWNLHTVWNNTLDNQRDRPLVARDYIYASELGGSFCDRYLKMNAVPYTNPPNERSRRKFQAGNMWEWVVGMVLISGGLLKNKQIRVESKLPRLLKVSGRLDYIVGGQINWEEAKKSVENIQKTLMLIDIDVPPFFFSAIDKFIDKYKGKLLQEVIMETKSVSSFMMEKIQKTGMPMPHHVLQNFHYVNGNDQGINLGKLEYICKDDCIMEEFDIKNDDRFFEAYKTDIRQMTKYYNAGFDKKDPTKLMPPKEPLVVFEEGTWRFAKNFWVEYSSYLTMLYGYATPEAYRMGWQYKVRAWNRVFKRCVKGDKMTDKNITVIEEAEKYFPNWNKLVAKAKAAGAFQNNEEEAEDE